jgi:hypothetical protein
MPNLHIRHHERVEGHPHRWHVHLHGRDKPVPVELPEGERRSLEMSDEDIHTLLPTALQRHADEHGLDPEHAYHDTTWDAPVRVMQTHFTA